MNPVLPLEMISVVILTKNEERDIAACLDSVSWSDDIVVVDSGSDDATTQVAEQMGARVFYRQFDNFAAQRSWALEATELRNSWVLMVDADERVTPELRDEIMGSVREAPVDVAMFRMRRKDFLFGKWLRRSSGYPTWFGRLFRNGQIRILREINEEYIAAGRVVHLRHHLEHFPFSKGFEHWIKKHNTYSSMEAALLISGGGRTWHFSELLAVDPVRRRRALKAFAFSLPARPIIVFIYLYIVRLGFLDGTAGFAFCALRAVYEWFIDLKVKEAALTVCR